MEAGAKIWVDPYIEFDHAGVRGMLVQALTDKADLALKPSTNLISDAV